MTPARYCQEVVRRSGSSFYYALLLCPEERRRAMYALYAFCRSVDDCVDCCQDWHVAGMQLDWWRDEMTRAFAGVPQHPIAREVVWGHDRFGLEPAPFFAILDGMAMDLAGQRYPSLVDLEPYCHRVAVTVGQVALRLFGVEQSANTDLFAHHLGMALQLTNIVRDVADDARLGRLYLPLDMLREAGIEPDMVLARRWTPGMQAVLERMAGVALDHFQRADRLASEIGRRQVRPALAMGAVYRHHLDRLRRQDFNVLDHPVIQGTLPRVWMTWKTWFQEGLSS
ncbi:MAG: presqualene diphosphate synthase HpnD [Magnetococcales bacterium]|nr:presqualene diphosphate synthase HpnD [Magnetococcales bacterium]